jgi:hypothetical protein
VREGGLTVRTGRALWVLLLLAVLVPLFVAILWGDVYTDAAYQRFQKARAIARGIGPLWDGASPLYTMLLALMVRFSSLPALDGASGLLPTVALLSSVLGWAVAIAAWFLIGLAMDRLTFSVAATVLLALNPLQARVLGMESGLVLGLFGLATLSAVRGKTVAMLIALIALVATQPMMLSFAVLLFVFSRIWKHSSPTLVHVSIIVAIGSACYVLISAVDNTWIGSVDSYREPLAPLVMTAQILVAIGFAFLVPDFDWLVRPPVDRRTLQRGLASLCLVMLAVWQGRILLDNWLMRPAERLALYGTVADWLQKNALSTETVSVLQAGLLGYLADRSATALPDTNQTAILLAAIDRLRPDYCVALDSLVWNGVRSQSWFQERYEQTLQVTDPYDSATPLTVFRYIPSPFDAGETVTATARFTPDTKEWIELTGYRLDSQRITPGEPLHLTLYWRATTAVHQPLFSVIRLINATTEEVWTRTENLTPGGLATHLWNADMQLADPYTVVPPAYLPPGDYALDIALYRHGEDAVPVLAGKQGDALRRKPLALAQVYHPPNVSPTPLVPDRPVEYTIADEIGLVGYDAPERSAPGDVLRVTLYWHALQPVSTNYKVFVHLLGPDGRLYAQDDSLPVQWSYPTTLWEPGEYVRDEHVLTIDPMALRGDYVLSVGVYDANTGERAIVRDPAGLEIPEGRVVLQQIQVR